MKFSTTAALLAATSTTVLAAPKALMPLQLNNLHMRYNKGIDKVMVDFDLIDLNEGTSSFECKVQLYVSVEHHHRMYLSIQRN